MHAAPFVILLTLLARTPAAAPADVTKNQANKAATVLVISTIGEKHGMGTGVVVDARGTVLTNFHVIDFDAVISKKEEEGVFVCADPKLNRWLMEPRSEALEKHLPGNMPCRRAKLVGLAITSDQALLTVPTPFMGEVRLTDQLPEEGDSIHARAGIIGVVAPKLVRGHFIGLIDPDFFPPKDLRRLMPPLLMLDLSINPGGSGGPLFDAKGNMFGLIVAVMMGPGRPNGYAIPGSEIIPFVKQYNPFPPRP